jgi:hypothetical protein
MVKKGKEIRFLRGTYEGKKGWIDDDAKKLKKHVHVILALPDGGEETKRVWKSSVRARRRATSHEEAILDQNPDIDGLMDRLAGLLAKCEIQNDSEKLARIFIHRINEANERQDELGHRATWRNVSFNDETEQQAAG